MECVINNTKIKFDNGEIYSFIKKNNSKVCKWYLLKGSMCLGYRQVRINKKSYQYHRLIYKLHNPEWDMDDEPRKNQIDHIDRNKLNNNITNLRVVSHQQNQFNKNCKGYCYDKRHNSYRVQITINGEKKHYTVKTEDEAILLRAELKKKYHKIDLNITI